jgi:DNA-binding NarL/FixJ family response regulator/class 3 adenylate cyclase
VAVVPELLRGTVTLLFTDVEDSTGLVHGLGDDYARLLAEHRRIVRAAVEGAGGQVVECRADEFFACFRECEHAVAAAVDAQRALGEHPWPPGSPFRVRMGMHTGEPGVDEEGYFGLDVHRAARIASAAHGGQVLLSRPSLDHLRAGPEAGLEFTDLGEHRLRGLPRPERIFQLVAAGLRSDFPPLRFSDDRRANGDAAPPGPRMRVVLAEDSVLLREGIARLLEDAGFEIVGQAGDAEDLLLDVQDHEPDVAVVDIRMPPTHTDEGVRAARTIREQHPGVGVLVLSQYAEPAYAIELLGESAEGVGYLLKDRVSDVLDFAAAVRRVGEGGSALDPEVVSQLVGRRRSDDALATLTAREREVLELMAEGRSNEGIAERLVTSEREVEALVASIFGKLKLPPASEEQRRLLAVLAFLRS